MTGQPPTLLNLPAVAPGVRLLGFAGVRCLLYADASGFIGVYRDIGMDDVAELTMERRSAFVDEHLHSEVLSADVGATHLTREDRLFVASTAEALIDFLRDQKLRRLVLGRDDEFMLGDRGDVLADINTFDARVCGRDEDCAKSHALIGYRERGRSWIWHLNLATGAVVPPRPFCAC